MDYSHLLKINNKNIWEIKEDEYLLCVIDGKFGKGKTIYMVRKAIEGQEIYNKIYANLKLKNIKNFKFVGKITGDILKQIGKDKGKKLLLITEGAGVFDRRRNTERESKLRMEKIFQMRKLDVDIYIDMPKTIFFDDRIPLFATDFINAVGELRYFPNCFLYTRLIADIRHGIINYKPVQNFVIKYKNTYNYYDTKEITEHKNYIDLPEYF